MEFKLLVVFDALIVPWKYPPESSAGVGLNAALTACKSTLRLRRLRVDVVVVEEEGLEELLDAESY